MKKILLIEDNPEMRENTSEILELAKYNVITAVNGKEGVKLAQSENPDLIICDIMMPELDGYGVLHMLSNNSSTACIPFIFLTAKAEKSDIRTGMGMGADDYVTKPFENAEILQAVETRLRKNDILRKEFSPDTDGLNEFIKEAKGTHLLKELSENRDSKHFKKREFIYDIGHFPRYIFFVASGKIKTAKPSENGKEYITGLYKEGDFLGYTALLEDGEYTDSAVAMEDTDVVMIPKEEFFTLLYSNRDVAARFIKILSGNVAEMEDRLVKLAYNSVRKRVAEGLIMLQERYAKDGENLTMAIPREDFAGIVGTSTETVTRALSEFKEEGLIAIKGSTIAVINPEKLRKMKN